MGAFGLYRERRTPLHAVPAWAKVLGLVLAAGWLAWSTVPSWSVASMIVAIALLASTLPPPGPTLRGVAPVLVLAGASGAYQLWQGDARLAVDLSADFVSLICLSLALTTSTPLDESMGLVSAAARPFRRWIPSDALALVFSLTFRAIPEITRILAESRDAARSRGLGRSPRAMLIPAGVRTVGYALAVGDAITARGLSDADPPGGWGQRRLVYGQP
jgi:biotin transport system permease protein